MILGLKIDVATLRGMREGVPRLLEMLARHGAGATFLFNVGPDPGGRALRRLHRGSAIAAAGGVVSQHGMASASARALWTGPEIGRRAGPLMRSVRDAGFETGVHGYDYLGWLDRAAEGDAAWIESQLERAIDRYAAIFGEPPRVHGAPGWQSSRHALRLTQRLGFDYGCDGRGRHPHLPVWDAELVRCPQLPTTLPTLDELIGQPGIDMGSVVVHLLSLTRDAQMPQVFTLRAEIEGGRLAPVLDALLEGWRAQGYGLTSLRTLYERHEPMTLPRCEVGFGTVPGRTGRVLVQRDEFLGEVEIAEAA